MRADRIYMHAGFEPFGLHDGFIGCGDGDEEISIAHGFLRAPGDFYCRLDSRLHFFFDGGGAGAGRAVNLDLGNFPHVSERLEMRAGLNACT